jgi:hypothetical protein
MLSSKSARITKVESQYGSINKIMKVITPFRWLLGVFCFLMTLVIFFSLSLSAYDRLMYSTCGIKCGFVMEEV